MPEVTTPAAPEAPSAPAFRPPVRRKGHAKRVRNAIIGGTLVVALAVGGFFLYRFLLAQDELTSEIQSSYAMLGSIQSRVQGSGMARAKETAAITLSQGGTVQEVFVAAGDMVFEGQPLYTIFSQAAQDDVEAAQEKLDTLNEDMADLNKELGYLTVTVPFSGKLVEVGDFTVGDRISSGTQVATLVNDRKLKLSLYFSYAYENDIRVGQAVEVSVPAVMGVFSAQVEAIHKVSFISPEGAAHFEVVVVFDNPGTLTAGMAASAVLTGAGGEAIYPYENGETEFYETRSIVTETGGPLLSKSLLRYANVNAGDILMTMGSDTIDSRIREKRKEIETAQESLATAQKNLGNFNAVSPIDGRVTICSLSPGAEVKGGDTVIMISNNTTMLVDITVDDRNISFVTPSMMVELFDWNGNTFMGTVTSINTGDAQSGNGMTSFPVTLTVENYSGALMEGAWLDYSFVASQSDDCIVVPTQAVKYVSGETGETFSVVFVKADARPENTVTLNLPEVQPGQSKKYPDESDGYYPVPVSTGLSDTTQVEILEGLEDGQEIFVNFFTDYGSIWN